MRGQRLFPIAFAAIATLTLFVAGCSGSGTSVPVAPIGAALAPDLPSATAFSATSTIAPLASAGAATLSLPLPGNANFSGTATFPVTSVPSNLRLTLTYSNAPPAGLTRFAAGRQTSATGRKPLDAFSTNAVYACFAANYTVTLNGAPQYQFVLPPGWNPPGIVYYMALWDMGQWVGDYGGPGAIAATASATNVSISGRFPFAIPANGKVCVALYGRWETSATPTSATPPPSTVLAVTAEPLAINAAGGLDMPVGTTETLLIDAADAPATAATTCASLATLGGSPGAVFTIVANTPGTCSVTLTSGSGKTTTITVTIFSLASELVVTGSSVAISNGAVAIAAGSPEILSIREADGPATVTTTCGANDIATLSGSPGTSFTLTGRTAGTCVVTLTNGAGKTVTIQVIVSALLPPGRRSPIISPAALAFTSTDEQQPLLLTESGYTGALTESDTCAQIATVSPATANGPSATFTVTSVAAGSCTVTITDSDGQSASANIGVVTLGVTINSKVRRP